MADPGERLYEAMATADCPMVWADAHPGDREWWAEIEAKARRLAAEDIDAEFDRTSSFDCKDSDGYTPDYWAGGREAAGFLRRTVD